MRLVVLTALTLVMGCRFGFEQVAEDPRSMADAGSMRVCAGYARIGDLSSTYRSVTSRSWLAAEQACEVDRTHLVIVDDLAEEEAVRAELFDTFWIGTTDRITERTFIHVNGAVPTYTNWNTTTDNAGEDCASVLGTGKWEDQDCNISLVGVCECDDVGVVAGSY